MDDAEAAKFFKICIWEAEKRQGYDVPDLDKFDCYLQLTPERVQIFADYFKASGTGWKPFASRTPPNEEAYHILAKQFWQPPSPEEKEESDKRLKEYLEKLCRKCVQEGTLSERFWERVKSEHVKELE